MRPCIVTKWRRRFPAHGLTGLIDLPRASKQPIHGGDEQAHSELLDKPPPAAYTRWTGLLLVRALEDVDVQ
jgi:hypothetical protein